MNSKSERIQKKIPAMNRQDNSRPTISHGQEDKREIPPSWTITSLHTTDSIKAQASTCLNKWDTTTSEWFSKAAFMSYHVTVIAINPLRAFTSLQQNKRGALQLHAHEMQWKRIPFEFCVCKPLFILVKTGHQLNSGFKCNGKMCPGLNDFTVVAGFYQLQLGTLLKRTPQYWC